MNPNLQPLIDVLVAVCVREIHKETPPKLGKHTGGVKGEADAKSTTKHRTPPR